MQVEGLHTAKTSDYVRDSQCYLESCAVSLEHHLALNDDA
jgi:hypothetical protein